MLCMGDLVDGTVFLVEVSNFAVVSKCFLVDGKSGHIEGRFGIVFGSEAGLICE